MFLWKGFSKKDFDITINNIISVEVAKVLEYLSLWGLSFAWRFFWVYYVCTCRQTFLNCV